MATDTLTRSASAPPRQAYRGRTPTERLFAGLRRAGIYLVITVLSLFCVAPFLWLLLSSIDKAAGLYLQAPALTGNNFVRFFTDPTTPRLLFNSLLISGGSTLLALVLSMFGGYALSRFSFFGRRTLMFTILLVRVVPATATIVPLYLMMIQLRLNNSYVGLILVEAAYQLPLVLWLMKGFFDSIPVEVEEAAWIDGCTRLGGAVRIVFPLSRPGLGAAALFTFINVWGDFLTPLVLLQSEDKYPISIGMFRAFSAHNQIDWGLLAATGVLYMVPTVVLYLFARQYLLRATMTGALKG